MAVMKCLVIDPMHESLQPLLAAIGVEIDYQPECTREQIQSIHHQYTGLIVRSKTIIDETLLGSDPKLKFIGRAGAGLDNLDLPYLKSKGIAVLHASEGNRDAVGEHTVGLLLSLLRHIPRADSQVRESIWNREGNRGMEIMGKTVSIIGYGNMGQAFAKRLSGFGCTVLAYDKYKTNFSDAFGREASMETIFNETDILSLHLPLTTETRGLVNADYLRAYKKQIVLLNTARGEILALTDLASAIKSEHVRGAALDVLENEKLTTLTAEQQTAFNFLSKQSNVLFTPHIAGWSYESHVKINVVLRNKIQALNLTN